MIWKIDEDAIIPYFELMRGRELRKSGMRFLDKDVGYLVADRTAHTLVDELLSGLLEYPNNPRMLHGRERIIYNNMKATIMARFAKRE